MKFLNFLKRKSVGAVVGSLSDSDVDLLACMCQLCEPKIVKDGFITKSYAYYVPQDETDLEIAKDVFTINKIPVQEHMSRISGGMVKQKVLRVDYRDVKNQDKLKQEMKRVEQRCVSLYRRENWEKISVLQYKIQELKKAKELNQKQR